MQTSLSNDTLPSPSLERLLGPRAQSSASESNYLRASHARTDLRPTGRRRGRKDTRQREHENESYTNQHSDKRDDKEAAHERPNDPSSATRRTGRNDGNRDVPAGYQLTRVLPSTLGLRPFASSDEAKFFSVAPQPLRIAVAHD